MSTLVDLYNEAKSKAPNLNPLEFFFPQPSPSPPTSPEFYSAVSSPTTPMTPLPSGLGLDFLTPKQPTTQDIIRDIFPGGNTPKVDSSPKKYQIPTPDANFDYLQGITQNKQVDKIFGSGMMEPLVPLAPNTQPKTVNQPVSQTPAKAFGTTGNYVTTITKNGKQVQFSPQAQEKRYYPDSPPSYMSPISAPYSPSQHYFDQDAVSPSIPSFDQDRQLPVKPKECHTAAWSAIILGILGGGMAIVAAFITSNRSTAQVIFNVAILFLWTLITTILCWVLWRGCHQTASWWLFVISMLIAITFFVVFVVLNL
jgi:hypothetical protein